MRGGGALLRHSRAAWIAGELVDLKAKIVQKRLAINHSSCSSVCSISEILYFLPSIYRPSCGTVGSPREFATGCCELISFLATVCVEVGASQVQRAARSSSSRYSSTCHTHRLPCIRELRRYARPLAQGLRSQATKMACTGRSHASSRQRCIPRPHAETRLARMELLQKVPHVGRVESSRVPTTKCAPLLQQDWSSITAGGMLMLQ